MPTVADFTANPDSFLKNNMFLSLFSLRDPGYKVPGVHDFVLSDDGFECTRRGTGVISRHKADKTVKVWSVYPAGRGEGDPIRAYWLPYERDHVYPVQLRNEADIMFTPLMDGCSFSFTDYGKGTGIALHANMQTEDGRTDEAGMRSLLRGKSQQMHKSDYMGTGTAFNENVKMAMIGVRKGGKWSMYYQRFEDKAGVYYLIAAGKLGK